MGTACCRLVKHKQREEEMQERYIQRENTTSARRPARSFNRQVTCFMYFLSDRMPVVNRYIGLKTHCYVMFLLAFF